LSLKCVALLFACHVILPLLFSSLIVKQRSHMKI
jgi:hypothetical protein